MLSNKANPTRLFLVCSMCTSAVMTLIFTVNMIYFVNVASLNPLQMVLVGASLETAIR